MTGKWGIATKGTTASYPYTITMGAAGTISNAATLNANTAGFTLEDSKQYTIFIQFTNNTSLNSAAYTTTIEIGANSPIFFINSYGIGVKGAKASSTYPLNVSGNANISGALNVGGNISSGANITAINLYATGSEKNVRMYVPNASYAWITTDATSGLYVNNNLSVKGEIYAGSSYSNRVYHTGYKPTPADIGAAASSHTHSYLPLTGGTVTGNTNFTGGLQAGGRNVISSGSANSGWYIRYHDGTQICGGSKYLGVCNFNNNRVPGVYTVETSSLSTSGFLATFAANFISVPYCVSGIHSNGFTFVQTSGATTSSIYARCWASYSGTHEGVELRYIAYGRWY